MTNKDLNTKLGVMKFDGTDSKCGEYSTNGNLIVQNKI